MIARRNQTPWTQEATDLLVELYKTGVTASQSARIINNKFGTTYTRNAILGKRDRVGLGRANKVNNALSRNPLIVAARDAAIRRRRAERIAKLELAEQSRQRKREIQALKQAEAYALRMDSVAPIKPHSKATAEAILSLKSRSCRYPIGAVGADDFRFCCEPQDETSSYCSLHRAICTVVVPTRRKRAA